jgi:hypothetical protein
VSSFTVPYYTKPCFRDVGSLSDLVRARLDYGLELLLNIALATIVLFSTGEKNHARGCAHLGLKSFACNTFAISITSKVVIRYNLTSFRNRVAVQAFFGRPITRLRFELVLASCESWPYLRFSVGKGGGGDEGLHDRVESTELKMEDFALDGLMLN